VPSAATTARAKNGRSSLILMQKLLLTFESETFLRVGSLICTNRAGFAGEGTVIFETFRFQSTSAVRAEPKIGLHAREVF
jgi:hypothetical protein